MTRTKQSTLNKSLLLNWLYLTSKEVSLEELSRFIEEKTNGEYSIKKTSNKKVS
jgi:hypothetical protein